MRKNKFNLTNSNEKVCIEFSSNIYCQLTPNYQVWVVNREGETLHYGVVHERALDQYVEQISKEFNVVDQL